MNGSARLLKLYKEPFFHFFGIGALLFIVFALVKGDTASIDDNHIKVTTADIERIESQWNKQWKRKPTETELEKKGAIDEEGEDSK